MSGRQAGFWDIDARLRELSAKGDALERVNALVDFEAFRAELEQAVPRADRSKGGRPPYDHVLMFDPDAAGQPLAVGRADRVSHQGPAVVHALSRPVAGRPRAGRELDLDLPRGADRRAGGAVPALRRSSTGDRAAGYIAMGGQIVDATVVAAPKQRNTEDEKRALKEGRIPEAWAREARQAGAEGPRRALDGEIFQGQAVGGRREARRHRHPDVRLQEPCRHRPPPRADPHLDRDRRRPPRRRAAARPARQGQHRQLGLGRHRVSLGEERGASRGQRLHQPDPPQEAHGQADAEDPRANAAKSEVRAHVEHVFARQKGPMALVIRTIGLARAEAAIVTLANMAYNMKRWCWLDRRPAPA